MLEPVGRRLGAGVGPDLGPAAATSQARSLAPSRSTNSSYVTPTETIGPGKSVTWRTGRARPWQDASRSWRGRRTSTSRLGCGGTSCSGEYAPGERLVELQLTERYGAGRAAIRAALVELATEGLIDKETNRGASVRQISIDEAVQITEARAALESLIAAAAARNATDAERAELSRLENDMRSAVSQQRFLDYSELNGILHRRIREISGHAVAGELVAMLRNRSARHQYSLALMPGRPSESLEQHAAIIRAIVRGDERSASAAMQAHLLSVIDVLRHWDDANGTDDGEPGGAVGDVG